MTGQLKPGVYAYYVLPVNGVNTLHYTHYDGVSFSGPTPCNVNNVDPGIYATPCVFWESHGQYSGSKTDLIHVFLNTSNWKTCWLTSDNGHDFVTVNPDLGIQPDQQIAAILMNNEVHVYFNNIKDNNMLYHAKAGSWCLMTESIKPVLFESSPMPIKSGCSAKLRSGKPNLAFRSQANPNLKNQAADAIGLIWLSQAEQGDAGNGIWSDISPQSNTCQNTPALSLLGDDLFVTHQSHDDSDLVFSASNNKYSIWNADTPLPNAMTWSGPGTCVWGDRLYCFFRSDNSDRNLFVQVYMDGVWLPQWPKQIANVGGVQHGIAAVAVDAAAP